MLKEEGVVVKLAVDVGDAYYISYIFLSGRYLLLYILQSHCVDALAT